MPVTLMHDDIMHFKKKHETLLCLRRKLGAKAFHMLNDVFWILLSLTAHVEYCEVQMSDYSDQEIGHFRLRR